VEQPSVTQPPSVRESSHAVEERAGSSGTANQHTTEQQREEPAPTIEEPNATSGVIMGIVVVEKSYTENPASEAPAVKTAAV
jgi:hypothetical protein